MAITNLRIADVGVRRLEGSFSTDAVALPTVLGSTTAPAEPTGNNRIQVPDVNSINTGDVIHVPGMGPAGAAVVCGVSGVPTSTSINIQGTRISTIITNETVTTMPVINIKHNAKRIMMVNTTSGDSFEWNEQMGYGAALKKTAAGAQSFTLTDGFYVRGSNFYLHPTMYAINSTYIFSVDY